MTRRSAATYKPGTVVCADDDDGGILIGVVQGTDIMRNEVIVCWTNEEYGPDDVGHIVSAEDVEPWPRKRR